EPGPLAQPQLGIPRDGADLGGKVFQAELQMATDLRRIPIGPRPFDQRPPRMAVAGLRDATLVSALPGRVGLLCSLGHRRLLGPRRGDCCLGRRDSHADLGAVATQFSNSTEAGTSPAPPRQTEALSSRTSSSRPLR